MEYYSNIELSKIGKGEINMKRLKLRKGAKVVLTMVLVALSIVIYGNLGTWGEMAQTNKYYEMITCLGWIWMMAQVFVYSAILES